MIPLGVLSFACCLLWLVVHAQALHVMDGVAYHGINFTDGLAPSKDQVGWLGGDADVSVRLNSTHSVWIFADTLVGQWAPGKKQRIKNQLMAMPENTVAIVDNSKEGPIVPEYYYYFNEKLGSPDAIWHPANRTEKYWPITAVYDKSGSGALIIGFQHIRHVDDPSVLYIQVLGTVFVSIKNPLDAPWDWQRGDFSVMPFDNAVLSGMMLDPKDTTTVISSWTYIKSRGDNRQNYLMYAPIADVCSGDMRKLEKHARFWAGGKAWIKWAGAEQGDSESPYHPLPSAGLPELDIHFDQELGVFYFPYLSFMGTDVIIYYAADLTGEWLVTPTVYSIPPPLDRTTKYFCYAVKAHPELPTAKQDRGTGGEKMWKFSFACNVFEEDTLYEPGGIISYFPHVFQVRVTDSR
jgi:hypothetical protein